MIHFDLSPEVEYGLKNNIPILALESTVITHGMPYPENLETAKELEAIVRHHHVIPATICVLNGVIKVGMTDKDFDLLTHSDKQEKISQKDIVYAINGKLTGGTTVAATMFIAWKAGIKVFATGGIGGVHRNAEKTMDISSDIMAFSKYPVIVVSAGAKAILDLGKTLESLETLSVPVLGYKTDYFPAFYSSKSRYKIRRIESSSDIVSLYKIQEELNLWNGMLIANPIPVEHEIPNYVMEEKIGHALKEADHKKITGKDITPFLLSKLVEMTGGKSLKTNIELIKNNVKLGCRVATELVNVKNK